MGYRCPVCDTPQRDAGHLADHLAFTAMLRGEDHEAWLDERVPEWGDLGTETLAERVVGYAPEAEFEAVFEDTTGGPHTHAHDHGRDPTQAADRSRPDVDVDVAAARDRSAAAGTGDAEVQSVLREAREMTQEMLEGEDGADDDSTASAVGADDPDADGAAPGESGADADEEKES